MNLFEIYKIHFLLMYLHKFTLSDLENMMPWEREVYTSLLENYIEEVKKKKQKGSVL